MRLNKEKSRVLEARLGVLGAVSSIVLMRFYKAFDVKTRPSWHQNRIQFSNKLDSKKHYFSVEFNDFVFPGSSQMLPRHRDLLIGYAEVFLGHTDLFLGHTTWRFGSRTGLLEARLAALEATGTIIWHLETNPRAARKFQELLVAARSSEN